MIRPVSRGPREPRRQPPPEGMLKEPPLSVPPAASMAPTRAKVLMVLLTRLLLPHCLHSMGSLALDMLRIASKDVRQSLQ